MSKVAERKARLHTALIDHAEKRIAQDGLARLRARDLAADAGCSVGAIYNVFDDLDAIVLHVGLRTLKRIDVTMEEAGARGAKAEPVDRMVNLAHAYLDFVTDNTNLWRGLFEHDLPVEYSLPEWMKEGQVTLFRHIERPLKTYMPDARPEQISLTARSLFGAVHGIVTLAMERRLSGVDLEDVPAGLDFFVRTFVKGLGR